MAKPLPKGHLSCLSNAFRYTPAIHTNVADTFARIARELQVQGDAALRFPRANRILAPSRTSSLSSRGD
jgi:hypothetical protein